jgi:hypothetical protein
MEPEVHIIEKYFQVVLGCLTMANVKCKGGKEIDLLAINPKTLEKFHIEARVTVTGFKITKHDTYTKTGKHIGTAHRIGLDFFDKEKFEHINVKEKITEIFGESQHKKILVVWDVNDPTVVGYAETKYGIDIWTIRDLIKKLMIKRISGSRDDVLRLAELFYYAHYLVDRYEMNV